MPGGSTGLTNCNPGHAIHSQPLASLAGTIFGQNDTSASCAAIASAIRGSRVRAARMFQVSTRIGQVSCRNAVSPPRLSPGRLDVPRRPRETPTSTGSARRGPAARTRRDPTRAGSAGQTPDATESVRYDRPAFGSPFDRCTRRSRCKMSGEATAPFRTPPAAAHGRHVDSVAHRIRAKQATILLARNISTAWRCHRVDVLCVKRDMQRSTPARCGMHRAQPIDAVNRPAHLHRRDEQALERGAIELPDIPDALAHHQKRVCFA